MPPNKQHVPPLLASVSILCLFGCYAAVITTNTDICKQIYLLLVFFASVVHPASGAQSVILSLPLHPLKLWDLPAPFPAHVIAVALFGDIVRSLIAPPRTSSAPSQRGLSLIYFGVVSLLCAINAFALAAEQNYERLPHLLLFFFAAAYCFRLYDIIRTRKLTLLQILLVVSIGVVVAGLHEVAQDGFVSSARRLAIAGNIRALANTSGFVVVGATLYLSLGGTANVYGDLRKNSTAREAVLFVLMCISAALMLATQSRGVLLSASLAISTALLASSSLRNSKHQRTPWIVLLGGAVLLGLLVFFEGSEVAEALGQRMSTLEDGKEIRYEIWAATIEHMTYWQFLCGASVASFRDLAQLSGYDMYAHSVFVDTFVSFGALGLVGLVLFGSHLAFTALRRADSCSFGMLVFVGFSHLTHGTINSVAFLVFFAIVAGTIHTGRRVVTSIPDLSRRRMSNSFRPVQISRQVKGFETFYER